MPRQPSGSTGGVQLEADQAKASPATPVAIGHTRVVIATSRAAVAAKPNQAQPGKRTPAAVIGWAQPTIPNGGTLIRTAAVA
jgi:hypothetical protein